jgi:amino acid adenylation domain-containing protein
MAFLLLSKTDPAQIITPAERNAESVYPLSFAQQRFWFLDRLEPGNPALHIAAALHITGPLNIEFLRLAFARLAERHESLRTSFVLDEHNLALQKIHPATGWMLSENYDLSHLTEAQQQSRIQDIMRDEALHPFDLHQHEQQTPSLLRTRLARLTPVDSDSAQYILFLTLHHIIADGWSLNILIEELTRHYQALQNHETDSLPPLAAQYIDFSHWQQQWINSSAMQKQLGYWQQQLKHVPLLDLPTDYQRPKQSTHHGAAVDFVIDAALSAKVQALASAQNTSAYIVLLTAFNVLLHRYTQQEDICIGTPVAGRHQQNIENVIGCFINLLAIRNTIDGNNSFNHLISQIKHSVLAAQENSAIPFELVADHCTEQRSLSHTPLFQVLFTYQASDFSRQLQEIQTSNLQMALLPQPSFTAKYDMQLHIAGSVGSDEGLSASIEYNTDLFSADSMHSMARHFVSLVEQLCLHNDTAVGQLAFLSPAEYAQQMDYRHGWNATQFVYPPANSIQALIEAQAEKTPDALAVSDEHRQLTYRELNTQANQLAHYLISLGIHRNQAVAVCLERSVNLSVALLAILKAGGAYVPLATDIPPERFNYICKDTNAAILLSSLPVLLDDSNSHTQVIDIHNSKPWQGFPGSNPQAGTLGEDIFNIIYTSGSTGNPKGVMVPHRGIINRLRWMQHEYGLIPDDRILQKTPYNFDVSVWELFWPLMFGSSIFFARPDGHKEPEYLRDVIIRQQITTLHFVPSMLGIFLQTADIEQCTCVKRVFTSGEALQLAHNTTFFQRMHFAELHNLYGPTEASIDVSYYACSAAEKNRSVPIGKPIHNTQLHILDKNLNLLPAGAAGELYIGGDGLALGYLNQPELTASTFINNPYHAKGHPSPKLYKTGDVVRYLPTGDIEYLGRNDHQVKIRGFRIELGEIETQLRALPDVLDAIVISREINGSAHLLAFIHTLQPLLDNADYAARLKQHLPDYMIPVAYCAISEVPLSANGKVDRKKLPEIHFGELNTRAYIAPRNDTESELVLLWQALLQIDTIGVLDNFFELGGHSLIATQLAGQVSKAFAVEVPLKLLFEKPTIAELAEYIDQGGNMAELSEASDIMPADRSMPVPLSFAQERLWIIEQLSPGNTAYNIPFALQISGKLDKTALLRAINAMVERHEPLRTRINTGADGLAYQDIRPASEFVIKETNLPASPSAGELQVLLSNTASTPFHFSTDLLFRAELVNINTQEHILLACMHHIISDGWSLTVLQKELLALYQAYSLQPDASTLAILPALPHQYADYAVWQRRHATQEHTKKHLDYWVNHLANVPAFITLPTDKPRPLQQTFNGAMLTLDLPRHLAGHIHTYSQQHGTTPFNVLLSSYALLLGKYARQDDICIGTPVSGREKGSLQGLIGYFVNAVVIRNKLSGNPLFSELVKRTQNTALAAFAHQDVAIEQVLDKLQLERNPAYSPVAQVGFSYIGKTFTPDFQLDNLSIKPLEIERVVAKYDLTLIAVETGAGLQINLEYNTDLYTAATIEKLYQHYIDLLEQCLANPDTGIKTYPLLQNDALYAALNVSAHDVESILPLTPMQSDMVLSQWLNPASLANTLGYRAEVDFEVDADSWEKAIQLVSLQQPVTRTHFKVNRLPYGDFAYQCVYRHLALSLEVMDYRDELLTAEQIQQRVDAFIYQPQCYQEQQFIRYGLMRINGQRTILLLSSHHALLDGISIVIIAESTARYYEALLEHHNVHDVVNPPATFADYINDNIQQMDNTATQAFWQDRLKHCEATDFPLLDTTNNLSPQQIVKTHVLDDTLWQDIKTWTRKNRTTPAQLLKLVYGLFIANYCHTRDDFYFSEFHAGRDKHHAPSLGCFFLQSPFIFNNRLLQKDTPVSALFDYAREYRKTIKAHDAISMGLTRQLAPQGRLHFMFNYYHFFPQEQYLMGNPITCIETPPFIEQAVQFVIKEHATDCQLDLYYQTSCFSDHRLLERVGLVCRQIVSGVDTMGALNLLFPDEINQQLQDWNNTRQPLPPYTSVQSWFEAQAALTPDNIAVIDDTSSITYKELNAAANRLAHYLKQQGVGSDIRIGLCLNRNIHAITIILGIIKAGGAYVPVDASYPVQRIRYMLETGNIHTLITEKIHSGIFTGSPTSLLVIDDITSAAVQDIATQPIHNPASASQLADMLYVIFTSGSTGNPKGATVKHQGEINLLNWYTREFNFTAQSSTLIISALGFDLTQKNLFAPLVTGGKLVLSQLEHYDSGAIHQLIRKHTLPISIARRVHFIPW